MPPPTAAWAELLSAAIEVVRGPIYLRALIRLRNAAKALQPAAFE